ncbi:MAG: hypothetical protein FWF75_02685, partial [Propionibacteriaceae bacterium]|nr:hypothetical protein [Propionibacteriaceae bacterium]
LGIGTSSGSSPATSGMERAIATALSQPQGPVTSEQREQITQDIYDEAIGPINQMIYGGATPAQALSSRLSSMVGLTVFAAVVAAAAVLAWRHGTVTAPTVVLACALLVLEVVGLVRTRNGMDVRTKRRMWISLAWTFVMIAVPIVDLVGLIVVASHV